MDKTVQYFRQICDKRECKSIGKIKQEIKKELALIKMENDIITTPQNRFCGDLGKQVAQISGRKGT